MSKLKNLIKKAAGVFSKPVKPPVVDIVKEDKFNIDSDGTVRTTNIKIEANGDIHIGSEARITLTSRDGQGSSSTILSNELNETKHIEVEKLTRLMNRTKSTRIKNKLQKRISNYGK